MDINNERSTLTVNVANVPPSATAQDLRTFLESKLGKGTIFALEIFAECKNWKSRGHGRVQFEVPGAKKEALSLSGERKLLFKGFYLSISHSFNDIIFRPVEPRNRVGDGDGLVLLTGIMVRSDCMGILESWDGVKLWVHPERKKLEFIVDHDGESYKLEVQFGDVIETKGCCLDGDDTKVDAILLTLSMELSSHSISIWVCGGSLVGGICQFCAVAFSSCVVNAQTRAENIQKFSGPNIASKFTPDRYHICKEDFDHLWVRTTDFSKVKSIGHLTSLCWEIEGSSSLETYTCPYYSKDVMELSLEEYLKFEHVSDLVPIVTNNLALPVPYEVLFQLNSLVHTQKTSLTSIDTQLLETLCQLDTDTALLILKKMHKLHTTCFEPKLFIESQSSVTRHRGKKSFTSSSSKSLNAQNTMSCHRLLVTPSRIFCLGPELESSNHIVKKFASYASDFLRVTFVDEDWGRLSAHTFLAFSASQLRSNFVWMFASNEYINADDIRDWMGCFKKIRSISKCAARMGQLFSSSMQTFEVHPRDIDRIPDIEIVSDDAVKYCFSDGIGKISYAFAKDIVRKLGLTHVPSAFQIRYGGYKGVIVVSRNSFRKLALRSSMLKFESDNCMLNVTKWSESQSCYLNREIITLLSTANSLIIGSFTKLYLLHLYQGLFLVRGRRDRPQGEEMVNFSEFRKPVDRRRQSHPIHKPLRHLLHFVSGPTLATIEPAHIESAQEILGEMATSLYSRILSVLGCLQELLVTLKKIRLEQGDEGVPGTTTKD
ncbi:RNA-dependent RNA polymerase 2 [Striga asiatica]|uniref:RNA-dependent RNA polymerase n=1 Tax=Striga asiatica TaxID=4170 RepID=A0A5A7PP42_STRAF|nr:RNA-dependent RNA polymerase 2 [Striga asiatica]